MGTLRLHRRIRAVIHMSGQTGIALSPYRTIYYYIENLRFLVGIQVVMSAYKGHGYVNVSVVYRIINLFK
ncbi:hypothetical protein AJ87_49005 [Rhizobium yanglingense]|nr:hypothetical protein AJ87_49005 [Rhizobium yanglingense]